MPRILVIDDSLTIRKLIGLSLERANYEVVLAATGNEGLALAARVVPDLVMLDFRLPDLTADEICARLARDPTTSRVPVILMSARDDDVRSSMKSSGNAVDFVPKPFSAPVVLARVQQALAGRAASPKAVTPATQASPSTPPRPATPASPPPPAARTTSAQRPAPQARPLPAPPLPASVPRPLASMSAPPLANGAAAPIVSGAVAAVVVTTAPPASTTSARPLSRDQASPDDSPTPVVLPAAKDAAAAPAARARAFPVWPFAQKEQLARLLFAKLRGKLAQLPTLLPTMGDNPAGEIAKRLFTIDTIDTLIDALQPLFEANARPSGNVVSGATSALRLDALMRVLGDDARDGEIRVQHDGLDTLLFLQAGVVVLVTTTSVGRYMEGLSLGAASVDPEVMQRAAAEQSRSGKPVPLSLVEAGVALEDVSGLVQMRGMALLRAVLEQSGTFSYTPTSSSPAFVSEYGRPVTLEQIKLEDARASGAALDDVASWSGRIFARAAGFSRRVRRVRLDPIERRVGGAVDGRVSAQSIAARIGEPIEATVHALRRLQLIGLVDDVTPLDAGKPLHVVLVGERPEFSEALRAGIAQHRVLGSYRVVSPSEIDSVGDGCDLMIIGALDPVEVDGVLGRLRPRFGGAIAVLRAVGDEPSQRLFDLGATAVLNKPVHMPTLCSLA